MAKHYHAFISYSHRDERWARWLQRAIERYRVPAKLKKIITDSRSLPTRLHPVFRDRDELASSANLSRSIRDALDHSDALIVICSPSAARSQWVNEEVRHFRRQGRADRIFCILVEGSPLRDAGDCAFPPALLLDDDGNALPDPLAADVRNEADGKHGALLKIIAGLLAVGIDDLRQRDAQRQLRVRGAVAATSLVAAVVTIGLAIAAQLARNEAEIRRAQAESMIGFMLGDLRARLEPVGRLDLLDAVGDEAMSYFAALSDRGTEQEIFARAMALRQIGEVRFRQGRLAPAAESFEESRDIAEALYASAPGNQQYLFELGQAEFWVGYAALEQSDLETTNTAFTKYMEYSRTLLSMDPQNPDYKLELSFAYGNLGSLALEMRSPERALENFAASLTLNQELVAAQPDDSDLRHELGNAYSWLGAALVQVCRLGESENAYRAAVAELQALHEESDDLLYSEHFGQNVYHLGNVHANQGELAEAESLFRRAHSLFDELVRYDPGNAIWRSDRAISAYHLGELSAVSREAGAAGALLEAAAADFEQLIAEDPADLRSVEHLALIQSLAAGLAVEDGRIDQALVLTNTAESLMAEATGAGTVKPRTALNAGRVAVMRGRVLRTSGDEANAVATLQQALRLLRAQETGDLEHIAVELQILEELEDDSAARNHAAQLEDGGFNDPRFR